MSATRDVSILLSLMILAGAALALADDPELPPIPTGQAPHGALTLTQAVKLAIAHNPTAQITHEKLNELNADVRQAYSAIFPNISVTGSALEKKDPVTNPYALFDGNAYNMYTFNAQITQPIWESGLLSGGISLAKSNETVGVLNDDIASRTLALNVVETFYSIIQYQRNLASLEKEQKINEDLVKTITRYYHVGRNQLLDVLQEETTVATIIPQIAQAKNQIQISATQLATYLGDRTADQIEVIGSLDLPDRKAIVEDMKKEHLRVFEDELVDEQLRQVDYNREIGLAPNYPSLSAVAGWVAPLTSRRTCSTTTRPTGHSGSSSRSRSSPAFRPCTSARCTPRRKRRRRSRAPASTTRRRSARSRPSATSTSPTKP